MTDVSELSATRKTAAKKEKPAARLPALFEKFQPRESRVPENALSRGPDDAAHAPRDGHRGRH
ncbi:MAG: hypothetical protein K9G60_13050, partial [Pseudolabrys sp.]|nr:hypothetical protein [Pseudolabrys sp.]